MFELDLPWEPIPWAAPILKNRRFYNPRAEQKESIQTYLKYFPFYQLNPIKGYIAIKFLFNFPLPESASKKRKEEMLAGKILPTKCDATNCQKFYEDCLKNIAITDDRNVVYISSEKRYATNASVRVKIYKWEEYKNILKNGKNNE